MYLRLKGSINMKEIFDKTSNYNFTSVNSLLNSLAVPVVTTVP